MTTEYYLGPAGSQSLLPYPNRYTRSPTIKGTIIELQSGDARLHYQAERNTFRLEWEDLTVAERDVIRQQYELHSELSLVVGGQSYPCLYELGGYSEQPVPGSSPLLYNVQISLRQSGD